MGCVVRPVCLIGAHARPRSARRTSVAEDEQISSASTVVQLRAPGFSFVCVLPPRLSTLSSVVHEGFVCTLCLQSSGTCFVSLLL